LNTDTAYFSKWRDVGGIGVPHIPPIRHVFLNLAVRMALLQAYFCHYCRRIVLEKNLTRDLSPKSPNQQILEYTKK
jgi:hypothetical protein